MLCFLQVLAAATGVKLVDEPSANQYPMPLTATGEYDVEVRSHVGFTRSGVRDSQLGGCYS